MSDKMDERQLVKKISLGETAAFEELFEGYWQFLHNVVYNRLKSAKIADDLVQEVFIDIWKNRKNLTIHTSLKAYLYQAIKYKIFNFIRHQSIRRKEEYVQRIYEEYYTSNSSLGTEEQIMYNELQQIVNQQVDELPEKSRYIYKLSRDEHYTYREIADELGCSKKTVEYHMSKVLGILRLNLAEYLNILFPFLIFLRFFI